MRTVWILAGACLGVLAAALLFSSWLSGAPAAEPGGAGPGAPTPVVERPTPAAAPQAPPAAGEAPQGEVDVPAPTHPVAVQGATTPPVAGQPLDLPQHSPAVTDDGQTRWADPSPELDYAERLLSAADVTTQRATSAKQVFQNCLTAEPGNVRCLSGLSRARAALGEFTPGAQDKAKRLGWPLEGARPKLPSRVRSP